LGPKLFTLGNKIYERKDLKLTNERGLRIECSHFQPLESQRVSEKLPCVVYCHGNCGCRVDALDAVQQLLPLNITVFAFDFTGSGVSEGEYVSLGFYERQDVAAIVEHLWKTKRVSKIGLWGRSMGAATSLMYGSDDQQISAIVADSPFTSLEDIIIDLVLNVRKWIPLVLIGMATDVMRKSIQKKAGFDIKRNCPIEYVKRSKVPVLLAHADGDNFIKPKHSEKLFENYLGGDKNLINFDGDHNTQRPEFYYEAVGQFFSNVLVSKDKDLNKKKRRKR